MSTTVSEGILRTPADIPADIPGVSRVAIREIRESAFRALVAAGASTAEAKVAAEQVLFTELQRGAGLVALLAELAMGPWAPTGMRCVRDHAGERLVLRVIGSTRTGSLRQGGLVLDLLAAETEASAVVVSDGLTALSPLLEEPLIRAAGTTGCWVVAANRSSAGLDFQVASPDGAIGTGSAETTHRIDPHHDKLPQGVSFLRCDRSPEGKVTWLTPAEQQATRAAAAEHGRMVDAVAWKNVTTAARNYLVPEQ